MEGLFFTSRVLSKRTFLLFGFFTFLCVCVIAATYVTSRYALKVYAEDQLARISWDVALHQSREIPRGPEFLEQLRAFPHVVQAESLVFLRARLPDGLRVEASGQPLVMPWYVILSATNPELLPPAYRSLGDKTTLSLFGSRDLIQANLSRARGATSFALLSQSVEAHQHADGQSHGHQGEWQDVFRLPISHVVELDRGELNGWLLEKTGAISFVPYMGAGLHTPYDPELLALLDSLFQAHTHEHGEVDIHEESGDYLPEIDHMGLLARSEIISGWDLEGSRQRLEAVLVEIREAIPPTFNIQLRSDTLMLIERMAEISEIIGIVTLLMALPLIAIAWVFAANLVRFVILTERRTIGLMRLRGLRGSLLSRVFLLTILLSGLAGGLAGLVTGMTLPLLAYKEQEPLLDLIGLQKPMLALLFLVVGVVIALLIGSRLIRSVRQLTPREASHRFVSSSTEEAGLRFGVFPLVALVVGAATVSTWVTGFSLSVHMGDLTRVERLLDFLAIPLLVYGLAVLVASRRSVISASIRLLAPLSRGRLAGFAVEQAVRKPARVAGLVLVGSLAATITLAPSIASQSFSEKGMRGVKVQLGSDANFVFNTVEEAENPDEGLDTKVDRLRKWIRPSMESLAQQPGVVATDYVMRALVPLYMPGYGYGGTPMFLIEDTDAYLGHYYHEAELGLDGPFQETVARLQRGEVAISPAVADFWDVAKGDDVLVGYGQNGSPITARVAGILAMFPGAPQRAVEDRDSFAAAQVDYLSYLFQSEAFLVGTTDNPALPFISALVPQVAAAVATSQPDVLATAQLPVVPRDKRFFASEVGRIKQDMFIHLVGENFKIYLIAGLLIALFAVAATFLVNFTEDRRTLALLRVRGASPGDLVGALVVQLYSPLFVSLILGGVIGGLAGLGIAHRVWDLQRVPTIMNMLRTHLVFTWESLMVLFLIMVLLAVLVFLLGVWTFQRTAREAIRQE